MALDNVTSHFSTVLEPIASASFLSSLSIIHAVTPLASSFLITVFRTEWFRQSFVCRRDICRRFWLASFLCSLWLVRFELVSTGQTHPRRPRGQIVGARESLNGRKNMARRKVKNGEKSPWGQCLTRHCVQVSMYQLASISNTSTLRCHRQGGKRVLFRRRCRCLLLFLLL